VIALTLVAVAAVTSACTVLMATRLCCVVVWKLLPLIVSAVPAEAIDGAKPLIVGAFEAPTSKDVALVADPLGEVTLMGPLKAPAGTVATIVVVVADSTEAGVPPKLTAFSDPTALKPTPEIVTLVPGGPSTGSKAMIDVVDASSRSIEMMFPTASYE
jgi:hypothetical protein